MQLRSLFLKIIFKRKKIHLYICDILFSDATCDMRKSSCIKTFTNLFKIKVRV